MRLPAVLVLDDVQWADPPSLSALLFALRRLAAEPVLVVATVRTGELPEALAKVAQGRLGTVLRPAPLDAAEVQRLAAALGLALPVRAAQRLCRHTGGIPLYARALLDELPPERWHDPEAELPAPRPYAAIIARRLDGCSPGARGLVEAVAVLGPCSLAAAASFASVAGLGVAAEPFDALEEAVDAGLLRWDGQRGLRFGHPLLGASVLAGLGPGRRARAHRAAAELAGDDATALRHRAAAAAGPDAELAADFEAFAGRSAVRRPAAATALITASRLSVGADERDARLLRAVDWMLLAGDLALARTYVDEVAATAPGARRDSTLAGFALTSGDVEGAAPLLAAAWSGCDPAADPELAALIAHRNAFHALVNLRDDEVVEWTARAEGLSPDALLGVEWIAMHALALWRLGRRSEAYALLESAAGPGGDAVAQLRGKRGWLRCADDDLGRGRADLEAAAEAELRLGALSIGAIHLTTLARAHYAAGAWEDAVVAAERAVAISSELEHAPGRAFVWWGAVAVPAARGDWAAADAYAARGAAEPIDAPDRVVAAGMAQALPAVGARRRGGGDPRAGTDRPPLRPRRRPGGLAARRHRRLARRLAARRHRRLARLAPGVADRLAAASPPRPPPGATARPSGVDAPGFWPWQDLYADALVAAGRVAEADVFLAPHEALAAEIGHALDERARSRGCAGASRRRTGTRTRRARPSSARSKLIGPLGMPYERALIELADGQFLRRAGRRRAAALQLTAARDTFAALGARPALERAERELGACGLKPLRRSAREQPGLTPQEQAVARLVATGRTNRQVADELLLSTKTVEVHLTRIYAKLGISSRSQLAARRDDTPSHARRNRRGFPDASADLRARTFCAGPFGSWS